MSKNKARWTYYSRYQGNYWRVAEIINYTMSSMCNCKFAKRLIELRYPKMDTNFTPDERNIVIAVQEWVATFPVDERTYAVLSILSLELSFYSNDDGETIKCKVDRTYRTTRPLLE